MILPIHKIFCPTDFSEPSYEGLRAAIELAQHFEAKLLLAHVINPSPIMPAVYSPSSSYIPRAMKEMENTVKDSLKKVAEQRIPEGIRVQTRLIVGTPAHEIAQTAIAENVDIIVIATHGQSGWKKLLIGSVTEQVVRLADRPVLTIQLEK
jgi:nucleotide-binding universal stress UspA family protein